MTTQEKARKYLTDGRVKAQHVSESTALFHVQGSDNEPYFVKRSSMGWSCDCPAHVNECAHVLACMLITDFEKVEKPTFLTDPDITKLLEG